MVEFKKSKAFYKAHRDRLNDFLHPAETQYVESSKKPYESLAMILSAKEAIFKSLGAPWMGTSGFRDIQVLPGKKWFSFRLKKNFQKKFLLNSAAGVSFTKSRHHVIATCHPVSPCVGI